jgi:malonate transporter
VLDISLSLLPVFLLIAMGTVLKRTGFPGDETWPPLEKLVYFVLFPPLLFHTIVTAQLEQGEALRLAAAFVIAILTMTVLLLALRPALPVTGAAFSSMFQGAVRWNSYVALAVIAALLGPHGVALAAVAFAAMVPLVNVLSVLVITRYAGDTPAAGRAIVRAILLNPLIIACIAGMTFAMLDIQLPAFLLDMLRMMGAATIPLGLLAVGAALDFDHMRASTLATGITVVLKLLAMPILMLGACLIMGVEGNARTVAIVCAAVPPASSAYILARQLGGDHLLMATLVTVLTLVSVVTIPLAITLLG